MTDLQKSLLVCLCLMAGSRMLLAQDGKKINTPPHHNDVIAAGNCSACDSLGDEYLAAGDTSMAIYYFQQYITAHMQDDEKRKAVIKLHRIYNKRRQSFYLEDQ